MKFNLLFGGQISAFLWTWRTLGGVDEQNIEGVHPQFNQLVRRFGNTRGRERQQMVMNEFLFSHSTWIVETVDKMIEQTKRKRIKGKIAEEQERDGADAPDLTPVNNPRD